MGPTEQHTVTFWLRRSLSCRVYLPFCLFTVSLIWKWALSLINTTKLPSSSKMLTKLIFVNRPLQGQHLLNWINPLLCLPLQQEISTTHSNKNIFSAPSCINIIIKTDINNICNKLFFYEFSAHCAIITSINLDVCLS